MSEHVEPPFTEDQVKSLNAYQASNVCHPFTCICGGHTVLIATKEGWICPKCDYKQKWAHKFMADWTWKILEVKWFDKV